MSVTLFVERLLVLKENLNYFCDSLLPIDSFRGMFLLFLGNFQDHSLTKISFALFEMNYYENYQSLKKFLGLDVILFGGRI